MKHYLKKILLPLLILCILCGCTPKKEEEPEEAKIPFQYEHDPRENPEALSKTKESNLETYGQEEGPTPDQLYEKYGSWPLVIQKAFAPNLGMDAVCGLYDDNYQLYIELGLAPDAD